MQRLARIACLPLGRRFASYPGSFFYSGAVEQLCSAAIPLLFVLNNKLAASTPAVKAKVKAALSKSVDRILWKHWDPIGVNDSPAARNEYSNYVPGMVCLLQDGADAVKLAQHLHSLERVSIGIETNPEHRSFVAQQLFDEYRKLSKNSMP